LPNGIRQDTRWRTRHLLRPTQEIVEAFLADTSQSGWLSFQKSYLDLLSARFDEDRGCFEKLAHLATESDVYLGCNCPTAKNPDVRHCHTVLALEFMWARFPSLVFGSPADENRW
jgi:hypothetical protein